jgi:hypothetical protein
VEELERDHQEFWGSFLELSFQAIVDTHIAYQSKTMTTEKCEIQARKSNNDIDNKKRSTNCNPPKCKGMLCDPIQHRGGGKGEAIAAYACPLADLP